MTFQFEWHSILSEIPFWVTFNFEGNSILSDISFWVTFHLEWHSILIDIPCWVIFYFEWHSILSDMPFWVTFHFKWHFILTDTPFWVTLHLSNIPFWVTGWCLNLNDENWGGIGLSISNLCVSQSAISRSRDASASKNITLDYINICGHTHTYIKILLYGFSF